MRLTAEARHRVLSLVRHAAVAAGLGVGWLLLSGQSATADILGGPSLPAVPATVATLEGAPNALPDVTAALRAVPHVQKAVSSEVSRTTTTLASAAEAVPAATAPVLTGPLGPLAPVVHQTASAVGQTLTTAGGAVSGTVQTPLPVPDPLAVPDPLSGPVPAQPAAAGPAVEPHPAPAAAASTAATPSAVLPSALTAPTPHGPDWSAVFSLTRTHSRTHSGFIGAAAPGSPLDAPDEPRQLPLPAAPVSMSGGPDGPLSGGPSAASLAGGFLLAVPLFFRGRRRMLSALVPPTPAFDPGSTPD